MASSSTSVCFLLALSCLLMHSTQFTSSAVSVVRPAEINSAHYNPDEVFDEFGNLYQEIEETSETDIPGSSPNPTQTTTMLQTESERTTELGSTQPEITTPTEIRTTTLQTESEKTTEISSTTAQITEQPTHSPSDGSTEGTSSTSTQMTTTPVACDPECLHGGSCRPDGTCECVGDFTGDYCQCLTEESLCKDECGGPGQICQAKCDSFQCFCTNGTQSSSDGSGSCENINECMIAAFEEIDLCPDQYAVCEDVDITEQGSEWDGLGYKCTCPSGTEEDQGSSSTTSSLLDAFRDPSQIICKVVDQCELPNICTGPGEVNGTCKDSAGFLPTCDCEAHFFQNTQPTDEVEDKCFSHRKCFDVTPETTNCTYSNYYPETCSMSLGEITCSCPTGSEPAEDPVIEGGNLCISPAGSECTEDQVNACGIHLPCLKAEDGNTTCSCIENTIRGPDGKCHENNSTQIECSQADEDYCANTIASEPTSATCKYNGETGQKMCECQSGFTNNPKAPPPFAPCIPDQKLCDDVECEEDQTCEIDENGVPGCKCTSEYFTLDENTAKCVVFDGCAIGNGYDQCRRKSQLCRTKVILPGFPPIPPYECYCAPPFVANDDSGCAVPTNFNPSNLFDVSMQLTLTQNETDWLLADTEMNGVVFAKYQHLLMNMIRRVDPNAVAYITRFSRATSTLKKPDTPIDVSLAVMPTGTFTANSLALAVQSTTITIGSESYFQVGDDLIKVARIDAAKPQGDQVACSTFRPVCPEGTSCVDGSTYFGISSPFTCTCGRGYQGIGLSMDMYTEICQDIDECSVAGNNGTEAAYCQGDDAYVCVNQPGEYKCLCNEKNGFSELSEPWATGNETVNCVEVCDPRLTFAFTCEKNKGKCEFDLGSREPICRCDSGYKGTFCDEKIEKSSDAAIVGGVLGGVLALVIIVAGVMIYRLKKKRHVV